MFYTNKTQQSCFYHRNFEIYNLPCRSINATNMNMKATLTAVLLFLFASHLHAQTSIFSYGSAWKYLDNGSDQGTAWVATSFNDAAWATGNAQLGYGDGDEATIVGFGADANNKYITTYFRKTFNVSSPYTYSSFTANVKRDDGVIVYVNGIEVYRNNISAGTVNYTTLASLASDDGATAQTFTIASSAFVSGNNVIAVEIHQNTATSSDISFDMELLATPIPANTTLIAYGSNWKYRDVGNQGTSWRTTTYNDAVWASGNAQLGYGDGDEATVVSYGASASKKYMTTYFRKTITVDTTSFTGYTLNIKRDDGAVVYINGTEVYRTNMPTGTISYSTKASSAASDDGNTAQTTILALSRIKNGTNVIAVEIHQNVANSTDLSFDLELKGNTSTPSAILTRGPYMNMVNETAVTIRWRTNIATNSSIEVGTVHGTYPITVNDAVVTTEHEVRVTGLSADTKYFYRFGSSTQPLQAGTDNYFITSPPQNTTRKLRFGIFGDCGRNDNNYQTQTLTAYQNYLSSNPGEIMILLGDNAYTNGTDAEYQTGFFAPYQNSILKNHVIMPAPGNHDYYGTNQASRTGAYYQNFTMPSAAQSGGIASGTEAFYSWNRGNVHFISLDSYGTESPNATRLYDTTGPQVTWLKQDIAANTSKWVIVYWHHPPYTMGSHNSDTETELVNIRTNLLTILERFGVDLVLCGHSHDYERSYLLRNYFGNEASFNVNTHAVSNSSAKYNGSANSCAYTTVTGQVNHGTVYVVSGSAGASGGVQAGYPHNAMPWSLNDGGAMVLEVEGNRLDAKFIRRDQTVYDQFTILKDVNNTNNIAINSGDAVTLTASWIGNYNWSTGATTKSITVSATVTTAYTVNDGNGCVVDVFNVTVNSPTTVQSTINVFKITPSIVKSGTDINIQMKAVQPADIILYDLSGHILRTIKANGSSRMSTQGLRPGVYIIAIKTASQTKTQRIVISD
jgi:3',5'-cyclic AMP phosphodiesterase CpdA